MMIFQCIHLGQTEYRNDEKFVSQEGQCMSDYEEFISHCHAGCLALRFNGT